jgi:hypothetical protein
VSDEMGGRKYESLFYMAKCPEVVLKVAKNLVLAFIFSCCDPCDIIVQLFNVF